MKLDLEGSTILRYAHIYRERSSGGMEQYLRQLNSGLLSRHRLTIIQTHLVPRSHRGGVEVQNVGRGQLLWVPIYHHHQDWSPRGLMSSLTMLLERSRAFAGDKNRRKNGRRLLSVLFEHLRYRDVIWSDNVVDTLANYDVSVVLLHWLSYDVGHLIAAAQRHQVPYGIINHFDNRRLEALHLRPWLRGASSIGGVSNRAVPHCLQPGFVNLSDAVDVEYFAPPEARPVQRPGGFLILLPGRVTEGKGHRDLMAAVRTLSAECPGIVVAFAGAVEAGAKSLAAELEREPTARAQTHRILWLGELAPSELRDWYGASDVVVLPSYQEGLGRVLLEAQAMMKPVIGSNTGGIPDAIVHGKTGLLVPPGDSGALAAAIKSLLQSRTQRELMGNEGRRFVSEHYSLSALIARHEQFCRDLMRTRGQFSAPCVSPRPPS